MGDFAPDLIHLYLELRLTAEVSKIKLKLVLLTVDFKGAIDRLPITGWPLRPRVSSSRSNTYSENSGRGLLGSSPTMPRQILKPRSLDFDPYAPVCVGTSFEPELLISFFAFKFRRKSTHRETLNGIVLRYLDTPVRISILTPPLEGIHQPIDGIDVAQVKSLD
jgi:hypothetical protein